MKRNRTILVLMAAALLFVAHAGGGADDKGASPASQSPAGPNSGERINWQVISSGGTAGTSTNFVLTATVGQTAVGAGRSPNFRVSHGFWQEYGTGGCCGIYTGGYTGNCNCDTEGRRNLADITRLIDRVYITPGVPLCCEEEGNTNGDPAGTLNLADITRLIDYVYVSHAQTALCL